jgi:hypothetical protein
MPRFARQRDQANASQQEHQRNENAGEVPKHGGLDSAMAVSVSRQMSGACLLQAILDRLFESVQVDVIERLPGDEEFTYLKPEIAKFWSGFRLTNS